MIMVLLDVYPCFSEDKGWKDMLLNSLTLSKQALVFTCLQYKSFDNNVGKG